MLINARTGATVASVIEVADTRAARNRGLLGRDSLAPSRGLMLTPCFSIHTAFMQFAIDAVFIDRAGVIVRIVRNLPAWRLAASWRAHSVIEFAAGAADRADVRIGDRLYMVA